MQRRVCAACGGELPYGSHRRYHSMACRRMDTVLWRRARESGLQPRDYLASLLTTSGGVMAAAVRLGVDAKTVRRWCHALRLSRREVWGTGPIYVAVEPRKVRRRRGDPPHQLRLL